jgi:tripartite-type tricarboxylate transporter receptor subunit TctC
MNRFGLLLFAAVVAAMAGSAHAQPAPYPAKPIKLVVGFAPGGAADSLARAMSDVFGKALGQSVLVDNKPGNGSSIAAELVAKSPPDGYTLLIASPSSISVNPATGIHSVGELIAAAKKEPGKFNYATSGNGSAPHLGAAFFSQLTGTQMTHIPYRGGSLAIQSVMAGDTQLTFGTAPSVLPQVSGGKLLALAVSTRERSPLMPGLPGMKEAGLPEYNFEFWYGMFVPAGTPPAIVKKIYDATVTAMQQPSVKAILAREGTDVSLSPSPEQFSAFLVDEDKFWVNLARSAKVKID